MSKLKIITPYAALKRGMKYSEWKKRVPRKYSHVFNKEYWTAIKKALKWEEKE
jgi:hypothetical protein